MAAAVRAPRPTLVGSAALVASLAGHVALVLVAAWLVRGWSFGTGPRPASTDAEAVASVELPIETVPLDLPPMIVGAGSAEPMAAPPRVPPPPGGGEPSARPDANRTGRGGTRASSAPATNLADRDDGLSLTREVQSRLDRDQVQRVATARERASTEDRRSTTRPMELSFLATGRGRRLEKRAFAERDPSAGALDAPAPNAVGSVAGAEPLPLGGPEPRRAPGGGRFGGRVASPGRGVFDAPLGADHRASAASANARPMVTKGAPAVPSDAAGAARDDADSEQEVAATVQSIVHASTAGGALGSGPGGEPAPGPTGSGGEVGAGSEARPLGNGPGPYFDLDGSDPRLSSYRRSVVAKLWPLWANAFPRSAALEGKQGRAIVSMTIAADGSVHDVRIARPSGVPEFDANLCAAVLRASPFGPLPAELHARAMHWTVSFDAVNPAVR